MPKAALDAGFVSLPMLALMVERDIDVLLEHTLRALSDLREFPWKRTSWP
jgi:hypothetical protein